MKNLSWIYFSLTTRPIQKYGVNFVYRATIAKTTLMDAAQGVGHATRTSQSIRRIRPRWLLCHRRRQVPAGILHFN